MDPVESALAHLRDRDHPIFSSHGPMVVEALEALGRAEDALEWAKAYATAQQLAPLRTQAPLADSERQAALGDPTRRGAWVAAMEQLKSKLGMVL